MKCSRYTISKVTHLAILLSCPTKFLGSGTLAVAAEMLGVSQLKFESWQPIARVTVSPVISNLVLCLHAFKPDMISKVVVPFSGPNLRWPF